ncbi:MAG: hypothetical protein C5B50_09880 [Verrucomicrobia bacterium]|nr:MAG: hypothetical protein C5B50_09880 [Verrucomicrobiota bacterium]
MKLPLFVLTAFAGAKLLAQPVLVPSRPAIPAPPTPAGTVNAPALTPPAPGTAAGTATNATAADLAQALLTLQSNIEQALPFLGAFNNNFDFVNLAGGGGLPVTNTLSAGNFFNGSQPNLTAASTNLFLLSAGVAGTNGFLAFPLTRDTLRGLLILQADMQRLLPILQGVNGLLPAQGGSVTNGP